MARVIPTGAPDFTYTGNYTQEWRDDWGWVIRFKTSGTLTFTKRQRIDLFLMGGGGGGAGGSNPAGGGGGGAGYATTVKKLTASAGQEYEIVVGAGGSGSGNGHNNGGTGGTSSAFGYSANGGGGGKGVWNGAGGGGGAGSAKGGGTALESGNTSYNGSASSVYEFEDTSFTRLGGGGGGGATSSGWYGTGGAPYGATGNGVDAADNTGAGGSGGQAASNGTGGPGGDGGSGIVCIRNTEVTELPVRFNGRTPTQIFFNGALVEHLVVDGTEIFMERLRGWLGWLKRQTRFVLRAA